MSKLSNFVGAPQERDIEGFGKVIITPLRVRDLGMFKPNPNQEEQNHIICEMIRKCVAGEEDATDEVIMNLKPGIFTSIVNAVNEVNGFDTEKKPTRTA